MNTSVKNLRFIVQLRDSLVIWGVNRYRLEPIYSDVWFGSAKDPASLTGFQHSTGSVSRYLRRIEFIQEVLDCGIGSILELVGVGYRGGIYTACFGKELWFTLGFSHYTQVHVDRSVSVLALRRGRGILIRGNAIESVRELAMLLRALRRPDTYKGKGIRERGECLELKVGKIR